MNATLRIHRLRLRGLHGVMPQERTVGANFYYTLEAEVVLTPEAYAHDRLAGTVSYADLCDAIADENQRPAQLLEHLAYRTLLRLLRDFPAIRRATLRIDKENPPMGVLADSVGVELTMER